MSKWYIVRHGRTAWNIEGRLQGQSDTPLGDVGRRQAERLGMRLRAKSFAGVYSSDLSRAKETAEIIAQERMSVITLPELREIKHGVWEGLTYAEAEAKYPDEFRRFMLHQEIDFAAPEGESVVDISRRVRPVVDIVSAKLNPMDDVLIVAHSATVKVLAFALLGMPLMYHWRVRVDPGSISVISLNHGIGVLESWNDTAHLEGLSGE